MNDPRGRTLSRDWERVLSMKASRDERIEMIMTEKPNVEFCTGSSYVGQWNKLGMEGFGTFLFPHGKPQRIILVICHQNIFFNTLRNAQ